METNSDGFPMAQIALHKRTLKRTLSESKSATFPTPPQPPPIPQKITHILPALVPKHTAKVNLKQLCVDDTQRKSINLVYNSSKNSILQYRLEDPQEQQNALEVLQKLGLDRPSRETLESRWNITWSVTWGKNKQKWILFQW
ncbi:hypothetical protein C8J55DRAFT_485974 [Lentinula edodes]|uniref:Uncharacterized protein n=1 Tax=Lentinula lateritia TaxID=40482 RepID=A0A9W9AWJ9_9AGAR|nr:hypothetical protein C8J55DRAFT_485974 [Lentinula edodes]